MTENPYESFADTFTPPSRLRPSRLLFCISCVIICLLWAFYTLVLIATWNDYSNLRQAQAREIAEFAVVFAVYSIILGCLPMFQIASVYRASLTAARCTYWLSTIVLGLAIAMVPIYIVECRDDPHLRGTDAFGAMGFGAFAGVLLMNRRLHHTWIATLQGFLQNAS